MESEVRKCKDEIVKSKRKEELLRKDIETVIVKCEEFQSKSFDIEASYQALVEELKEKSINVLYDDQEKTCLEIEDTVEEIEDKFQFDVRKEWEGVYEMKKKIGKETEMEHANADLLCQMC